MSTTYYCLAEPIVHRRGKAEEGQTTATGRLAHGGVRLTRTTVNVDAYGRPTHWFPRLPTERNAPGAI